MTEIKAYKANDGKLFETDKEALMWERECDFNIYYIGTVIESAVSACDMLDWLLSNKEAVLKLYGLSDSPSIVVESRRFGDEYMIDAKKKENKRLLTKYLEEANYQE